MQKMNITEIFQVAIRIEENGEKFYRIASNRILRDSVKEIFSALADEEIKHKEIFEKMLAEIENYESVDQYPDEYFAYVRSFANDVIFTHKKQQEAINSIHNVLNAVEFAIDVERNSVWYYTEMKVLVTKEQQEILDKIIQEERQHFIKLSKLRESLLGK
ncbi:MAG: ferritin family protein [Elusimicrobiota bacterium]